ncbi:hypothetical protein PORY_002506 [Pneumocystis oryctolagi]|uniref:Uncharacterized protein n=1 Tax=Pneumocystis oryctolagi TaxID=42067 RepID=A0ACB7C8X3_9ASCO|nr:hypothetical protein PORY_002506 [Pneumocystis oryctolagi]
MVIAHSQPSDQHQKCLSIKCVKNTIPVFALEESLFNFFESLDEYFVKNKVVDQAVSVLSKFYVYISKENTRLFKENSLSLRFMFQWYKINTMHSVLLGKRNNDCIYKISYNIFYPNHKRFRQDSITFSLESPKAVLKLLSQASLNHSCVPESHSDSSQLLWFSPVHISSSKSDCYCDFIQNSEISSAQHSLSSNFCNFVFSRKPISSWTKYRSSSFNVCVTPPITQTILQELEFREILKNVQLRHDIVHDRDLQFRPNLDGERGKRKQFLANKYWKEVKREIERIRIFQMKKSNNIDTGRKYPNITRIFVLFVELRNILLNLLSSSNRAYIIEILDPNLIIQELIHNLFDIEKFVEHLVDILKQHCAPMRDMLLDKMLRKIKTGLKVNNISKFVSGLRMIFDILEIMKLDIANHQLRTLRACFLETAVEFEQKWFIDRINWGDIDISDALSWYSHFHHFHMKSDLENFDYQKAFVDGVIASIAYVSLVEFPSTFTFDMHRLMSLRSDIRDIVSFQLVFLLFWQLAQNQTITLLDSDVKNFKREIWLIVNEEPTKDKWFSNISSIVTRIVKYIGTKRSTFLSNASDSIKISAIESWLYKYLSPVSSLYRLVENCVLKSIGDKIFRSLCIPNEKKTSHLYNNVQKELYCLFSDMVVERLTKISVFHWKVFGRWYINYVNRRFVST